MSAEIFPPYSPWGSNVSVHERLGMLRRMRDGLSSVQELHELRQLLRPDTQASVRKAVMSRISRLTREKIQALPAPRTGQRRKLCP
jgi:hypothetical protein